MGFSANDISRLFAFDGTPYMVTRFGNGHINDTYLVQTDTGRKYILQKMNEGIFKNVDGLINNIVGVTDHIRMKLTQRGKDPARECLTVVHTKHGKPYLEIDKSYWRSYIYIEDAITMDIAETPELFGAAGYAFGNFQRLLADYPAASLTETIPDFHNTPKRFEAFDAAVKSDVLGNCAKAKAEIDWVYAHKYLCNILIEKFKQGILPLRVTHNDTKINNVMLDAVSQKPLAVVDLDTVMPGLSAYDFGDSIRSGATHAAEDEKDVSKIDFDKDLFKVFAQNYIKGAGGCFDKEELLSLPMGAVIMTLECGIRFLTDYLDGKRYFKTAYDDHNLVRARSQFKRVELMLECYDELENIVVSCSKEAR